MNYRNQKHFNNGQFWRAQYEERVRTLLAMMHGIFNLLNMLVQGKS